MHQSTAVLKMQQILVTVDLSLTLQKQIWGREGRKVMPLFWICSDVLSGFQSPSRQLYSDLAGAYA